MKKKLSSYHSLPTSHDPPFGISLHEHMETIEKTQYQAALAVTGAWQGTSRIKLYEELGWESLSDRRMCRGWYYAFSSHFP